MNKREIILDFTSLLDVIMIILFFFILFSHIETINAIEEKEKVQAQQNQIISEAENLKTEAETLLSEAEAKNIQADKMLKELQNADMRNAYNISGIMEFGDNLNMRIKLNMENAPESWAIDVYSGETFIESIEKNSADSMADSLNDIITKKGYTTEDTILCIFTYNASEVGTRSAYITTEKVFELIKSDFNHFFCSEINISQ